MNYIMLDLEWDGAYFPKIGGFINQILQIGAVKLNSNFDIVDTFETTVKSSFSKRVSKRFTELTGITKADMLAGVPLKEAFGAYNDWVGDDAVTMTWSDSDIYTILENEKKLLSGVKLRIDKYLDFQKYIQEELRNIGVECNSQISLLNAAVAFNINVDESTLHSAKADSMVCAALLKKCYNSKRFDSFVLDTSDPDFFERFTFKPYYITDIDSTDIDKSQFDFNCPHCGKELVTVRSWRARFGGFTALMYCDDCDMEYKATVKFRKMFDHVKVQKRISQKRQEESEKKDLCTTADSKN